MGLENTNSEHFIACVPGTAENSFWFAYPLSLVYFDGQKVVDYSNSDPEIVKYINDMIVGPDGRLWATGDFGLSVFDGQSWSGIGLDDAVPQQYLGGIAVDNEGNI